MNPDEDTAPPATKPVVDLAVAGPPIQDTIVAPPSSARAKTAAHVASGLWNWVLPLLFLLSLVMLILYAMPFLIYHWRMMDAQTEGENVYRKRLAELKAEAEFADQRLDLLDKRAHLVSLGFRELARKMTPIVVNVVNYREATEKDEKKVAAKKLTLFVDPENKQKYVQESVGSGILYKPGVILTNHHVIRHAHRLRVTFPAGRSVGVDPSAAVFDVKTDLAVLRLPEKLPTGLKDEAQKNTPFADSDKDVHVGDWVIAIGSPLGLRHTVTHGIISAKGRLLAMRNSDDDDDLMELLQTDAAIHPGNSGGPLFDQLGRVVGVNVMIASDNERNQGIGFAIPSNTAKRIADHLTTSGEVPRGFLGIKGLEDLSGAEAVGLGIDGGAVKVMDVVPRQAADQAGIERGDVIVRINKHNLETYKPFRHLRQIVGDLEPGTVISVEIFRDKERREITLTLGKRPANSR